MGDAEVHGQAVADANANLNPVLALRSQQLRHAINTLNDSSQLDAMRRRAAEEFRAILSGARPPTEQFKEEIKDTFINVLRKRREDPFVIEQLLWALTNLSHANSPLIHEMVSKGIIGIVAFAYRYHNSKGVKDQTVMCLGNFAGDCNNCRAAVAQTHVYEYMLEDVDKQWTDLTTEQRTMLSWCIRNIFRPVSASQQYAVSIQDKKLMLRVGEKFVLTTQNPDDEMVKNGLAILQEWMSFDSSKEAGFYVARNDQLMYFCVGTLFTAAVEGKDEEISSIIIRIVGNIAFNDDDIIKHLINYGFLNAMEEKLRQSSSYIIEADIYWCLSNILGSHYPEYVNAVLDRAYLWNSMKNACYDYEPKIRREAIFCVINVVTFFDGKPDRNEIYREFFGRLLVDTLTGFTIEENLVMFQLVHAVAFIVEEELRNGGKHGKYLITDHGLEKAVQKRIQWIKYMKNKSDTPPAKVNDLERLLALCNAILAHIKAYKNSVAAAT